VPLILSQLIEKAWERDGVVTAYVYGDFGSGKTSYALWVAYEVLGSWDQALKHVFFSPREAALAMRRALEKGRRLKIIVMDDAGLWLDRTTWWEEDKILFGQFFNLIRSVAAGVIFTTPAQELPRSILRRCLFRVSVRTTGSEEILSKGGPGLLESLRARCGEHGLEEVYSVATGYRLRMLPTFLEFAKKEYYDFFPLHYPVYREYSAKRRRALKLYFERWAESLKPKEEAREGRRKLLEEAEKMAEAGAPRLEIYRFLVERGVPKSTASKWAGRLAKESLL
jgi:hypothetical protein